MKLINLIKMFTVISKINQARNQSKPMKENIKLIEGFNLGSYTLNDITTNPLAPLSSQNKIYVTLGLVKLKLFISHEY